MARTAIHELTGTYLQPVCGDCPKLSGGWYATVLGGTSASFCARDSWSPRAHWQNGGCLDGLPRGGILTSRPSAHMDVRSRAVMDKNAGSVFARAKRARRAKPRDGLGKTFFACRRSGYPTEASRFGCHGSRWETRLRAQRVAWNKIVSAFRVPHRGEPVWVPRFAVGNPAQGLAHSVNLKRVGPQRYPS